MARRLTSCSPTPITCTGVSRRKSFPTWRRRSNCPKGWTFKVKTLDKDLTIESTKPGGVAHIIQDDLLDTYEGCGFDDACSYTP